MSPWPFPFGFGAVRSIIPLYIFNSDDGLDEGYRTKNVAEIGSGCCGVFVANFWYVNSGLYLKERAKFSPVAAKLDSAFCMAMWCIWGRVRIRVLTHGQTRWVTV